MIDIEDELFRKVATAVRAEFSNVYITGDYAKAPPKFPFVSFVEVDNAPYRRSQTNVDMENHVSLLYEVDVYSNKATGKKSECKAIIKIIDNIMLSLGFDRPFLNPIPNQEDATIYRMKARYVAVVSKDEVIYRR